MADVNANIGINIDTSQSLAEIKALQRQLAQLYTSINKGSAAAAAAQKGLATNLMNTINAGGKFYAQMGTIRTSTESFTHALEKNKLTMREYFRFAGGSTRTFGKLFKQEFDTIGKVAEERVKKMQTQYIKLGRDASGAMKAIAVTPTTLNMKDYGTQVAVAAQKQALLNQLLKQGSTNLLNFGKNTQWAGRQLMVGFTIPLAYFGTTAAKTFMDLEAQALKFRRVYGDMFTTTDQTNKALQDIEALAKEFTKYGVAVAKTMEMAASAAAMGKTGAELTAQVAQATRLAVLGGVEQEQALETTISLTNAFGIAAEDLASKINFLNSVENQTVVSIEDLTIAIPKAGPVIQQLGGNVEDLAFFLTAMKEGGINASEGANALKSGLASLINPTEKASEMLAELGINIKGIVEANKGDVKGIVLEFAAALDTLDPLNRARAIEQLFGKFQFARLSTLFSNVSKEGTQAARVLDLAGASVEELAILSERELKAVEDAVGTNFRAAVEELKLAIAPIGKEFLKAITPVAEFLGNLLERFNNLSEGSKRFVVILTTLVGLIGPTLLMTFGLVANGAANIVKMFLLMRQGFLKLTGNATNLAQQTQYLNAEQMDAAVVAASLNQAHTKLTQQFVLEASAVNQLRNAYVQATTAATRFAATNPGMMLPGFKGTKGSKFARGTTGVTGGQAGKDSVPSLLMPGEAVIPTAIAQDDQFKPLIQALVTGEIKKYKKGTVAAGDDYAHVGGGQLTSLDEIIARSSAGLSQTELRQAQLYRDILIATGKPAAAQAYGSLAYSFDAGLNKAMAKQGVPYAVFEKAWLDRPDKWSTSGFSAQQASTIDRAILEKIKLSGAPIVTDKMVDSAFRNLPESIKATPTYRSMAQLHDKVGSYSLGKGLGSTPATSRQILEQAKKAGIIKDYRVEERVSSKGKQAIKSLYVITNDGKETYLGRGARANRVYFADKSLSAAQKIAAKSKSAVVSSKTGVTVPSGAQIVGGKATDTRMVAKTPGEVTLTKKSAQDLRAGKSVVVPKFGRLKLAGFAEGDPTGQRPLSQAQIRAAQEGVSLKEAKRRVAADAKAAVAAEKQAAATENATKETKNFGAKLATGANIFSALTIAGSFLGGKIGEVAQKLVPFGILLSTLTMLGPGLKSGLMKLGTVLITNPWAAAAAAIIATTALIMKFNKDMEKARQAGIDLAKAMTMSAEDVKELGMLTGRVGASEIADRRRQNILAGGVTEPQRQFGQNILESEFGKQFLGDVERLSASGMAPKDVAKNISTQLGQAIMQGVITTKEAAGIASALGEKLGNYEIPLNITGNLNQIFGPNGENLATSPLQVALEIKKDSMATQAQAFQTALSQRNRTLGTAGEFATAGAMVGMGALAGGPVGAAVGAAAGIGMLIQQNKLKAENLTLDTAAIQLGIEAVAQGQDLIDSVNREYDAKIAVAKTQQEINNLEAQRTAALTKLNAENSKTLQLLIDQKDQLSPGAFDAAIKASADAMYKEGPMAVFKDQALEALGTLKDSKFKAEMQLGFASGDIDPLTLTTILKMIGEDKGIQKDVKFLIKTEGFADMSLMMQLLNTAADGDASTVDVILNYVNNNKKTFDEDLEAVRRVADFKGAYGVTLDMKANGVDKIKVAATALKAITDLPPTINKTLLQQLAGQNPEVFGEAYKNWDALSQGKDTISKNLVVNYNVGSIDPNLQAAAKAANMSVAEYLAKGFIEPTTTTTTTPTTPTTKKGRDTTLDNLLTRLKFIRKASIDAQGGVKELLRITSGTGLKNFVGVTQQLMAGPKGGANREFISFLEGMDNATRKTYMTIKNGEVVLTRQGKALKEAFNEKVIGEFQIANRQALQDTRAQNAALKKLASAGVDSSTALEMVADANLAVAINSKNISSKELRQMAKDAKDAKDRMKELNLEVLMLADQLKKDVKDAGDTLTALSMARAAGIVDPEVLKFISEDMSIVNKILKSGINDKTVQNILKAKGALKQLQTATEEIINPAEQAMQTFLKLKDAAFKVFDQQTRDAQAEFDKFMNSIASGVLKDLPAEFRNLTFTDAIEKANEDIDVLRTSINSIEYNKIRPIDLKIEAAEESIQNFRDKLGTAASKLTLPDGKLLPDAAYDDVRQTLEDKISAAELDLEFNPSYGARLVEGLQDQISKLELEIELNFTRPIADLQEESSDLANDLTLMDRVADQINKKYDLQADALQRVSEINQEILNQQKSQLDIANAITQGDIAAAARAAQEARAQAAAAASQRAGGVLDAARQAELGAIRSAGGMTREQIESRQFQISQQIYQLEEQSEARQKSILTIQDQIRGIEEIRTQKQREIRDIQDQISAGERARDAFIRINILPLENEIKGLQSERQGFIRDIQLKEAEILRIQNEVLVPLEAEVKKREKILSDRLKAIDAEKLAWENAQLALEKATTTAKDFAGQAGAAQAAFEAAKKAYDEINSKDVVINITETITRIVNEVQGTTINSGGGGGFGGSGGNATAQVKMYGGKIKPMAYGGRVGSDSVPALLTPGEFVVNKAAAKQFMPLLSMLNDTKYPSMLSNKISKSSVMSDIDGLRSPIFNTPSSIVSSTPISSFNNLSNIDNSSMVYNYNIGINVGGTNSSPNNIARAVIDEIKYIDSQRVRTQRAV